MPVGCDGAPGFRTKSQLVHIGAYATSMLEYAFYFPALGRFGHLPAHVSRGGKVIGFGQPQELTVVTKLTAPPDKLDWKVSCPGARMRRPVAHAARAPAARVAKRLR